jgi:hypothetical protein
MSPQMPSSNLPFPTIEKFKSILENGYGSFALLGMLAKSPQ